MAEIQEEANVQEVHNQEAEPENPEQQNQEVEKMEGQQEQEQQQQVQEDMNQTHSLPQQLQQIQTRQPLEAPPLSEMELAFAATYFSNVHGYTNPMNVITPQAMQARLAPVQQLSYHFCESLLREPHLGPQPGRAFAESKSQKDVKLQALCPSEVREIMDYRVSKTDEKDFALESFYLLGAKSPEDLIHVNQLAKQLFDCYCDLDYQMDGIEDYKLHCNYVREELEERAKKSDPESAKKTDFKNFGVEKKFELAPEPDVVAVLKMAIGGQDYIGLEDWRNLFENLKNLIFEDYRIQINKGINDQIPAVKRIMEEKEALAQ